MRICFPLLVAAFVLGPTASPAPAQSCGGPPGTGQGGTCNNLCLNICIDTLMCYNNDGLQQPVMCGGGGPYCYSTPIVIDTKNQGFHLTGMKDGVKFTFGANLLQTSWTHPDYSNAWLALDRNGNGRIDDASELFGDLTPQPPGPNPNGYKALAVFDDRRNGGNGNGRIDPGDAIWPSLSLWIDRNHNGISEPSELIPLSEAGIFSISLSYSLSEKTDRFGNQFRYVANIQDQYGRQDPLCYDVNLMTEVPGLTTGSGTHTHTAKAEDADTSQH